MREVCVMREFIFAFIFLAGIFSLLMSIKFPVYSTILVPLGVFLLSVTIFVVVSLMRR